MRKHDCYKKPKIPKIPVRASEWDVQWDPVRASERDILVDPIAKDIPNKWLRNIILDLLQNKIPRDIVLIVLSFV
jgi:hypothetical protein